MTNYLPALLSKEPVMPKDDDRDYNPEIDMMIEDRLFESEFENDLFERLEGGEAKDSGRPMLEQLILKAGGSHE